MVPQESVSSWLMDSIVLSEHHSHKKHQFNDTSFVLWEVRNDHIIIDTIDNIKCINLFVGWLWR